MTEPKIGVPRVYDGEALPVLYPGETASAQFDPVAAAHALEHGGTVMVTGWLVSPAPGWPACWRRVWYRIWGRWFGGGVPKLEISGSVSRGTSPTSQTKSQT